MQNENKRIARNTLLLYIRMIAMVIISLYTSRIVLKVLGEEDFGIYNVVGGIISFLGFLTSSLAGAASRFITSAFCWSYINYWRNNWTLVYKDPTKYSP